MPPTKLPVLSARVPMAAIRELEEIAELTRIPKGQLIAMGLRKLRDDPAIEKLKSAIEELDALEAEGATKSRKRI